MAAGEKKAGGGTEDKLRGLIKETLGELLSERDRTSSRESETKEQQWLRGVIREELGGLFEEFTKGYESGADDKKGSAKKGEAEDTEEGEGFLQVLLGGGGKR